MNIFDVLCVGAIVLLAAAPTSPIELGRERGGKDGRITGRECCPPRKYAERSIKEEYARFAFKNRTTDEDIRTEETIIVANGDFTYFRTNIGDFAYVNLYNQSIDFSLDTSELCYLSIPRSNDAYDFCLREFLGYERVRGKKYEVYSMPITLFNKPTTTRYYARRHDDGCLPEFAVNFGEASDGFGYSIHYNSTVTYERMEFDAEQEALLQLPPSYKPCNYGSESFNETTNSTGYNY